MIRHDPTRFSRRFFTQDYPCERGGVNTVSTPVWAAEACRGFDSDKAAHVQDGVSAAKQPPQGNSFQLRVFDGWAGARSASTRRLE